MLCNKPTETVNCFTRVKMQALLLLSVLILSAEGRAIDLLLQNIAYDIDNLNAFENKDSRYDNWVTLPAVMDCSQNTTQCSVLFHTVDGVIVRNYDELYQPVFHLVTDKKFKCHEDVEWSGDTCQFQDSVFGRHFRLNPQCGHTTSNCQLHDFRCPTTTIMLTRVMYSGKCTIEFDRSLNAKLKFKTAEKSNVCYEIYVDGVLSSQGYVNKQSPATVSLALKPGDHIIKSSCGSNDFSAFLSLGKYPQCIMWIQGLGVPMGVASVLCEYFYFFRVALIAICITAVFGLIHTVGFGKLLIPLYILVLMPFVFIQKAMARKKLCSTCASRLYWLVPHKPFCTMSCKRCGLFTGSDYQSLFVHKENCENAHNLISFSGALRFMISRKFFYRLSKLTTIIVIIWLVTHFNIAAAQEFNSLKIGEGGKIEAQAFRTGDVFNLPNVTNIVVWGGNGMTENDGGVVRSLLKKTADLIDNRSGFERQSEASFSSHENANSVAERLAMGMQRIVDKIGEENKNVRSSSQQVVDSGRRVLDAIHSARDKVEELSANSAEQSKALNEEIKSLSQDLQKINEWIQSTKLQPDLTADQKRAILEMERRAASTQEAIRADRRKLEQISNPRRHARARRALNFVPMNHEQSIWQYMSPEELLKAHYVYVKTSNNPTTPTVRTINPKYATRRFGGRSSCASNDIWITTVSQGESSSMVDISLQAQFPIAPGSCSVFTLKFKDEKILPTEMVVKVMQTSISWPVQYLYSSYRTIDFTVIDHESCIEDSGKCMADLKNWNADFLKSGGLIKAWDNCQRTGCEYFGCVVSVGGCCSILCRDVPDYRSEVKVFETSFPIFNVEICVTLPGHDDCFQVSSVSGSETQNFRFENVFSVLQSQLAKDTAYAIPTGSSSVYKGTICGLADYCDGFGALQYVNGTMHGLADIDANYECRFLQYHSYNVRKCYKNTHDKFGNLAQLDVRKIFLLNRDNMQFITERDLYMGQMTWQARLKNVIVSRRDDEIKIKAKFLECAGCYKCLQHAMCLLEIDSSKTFVGQLRCLHVNANENLFGISSGLRKYNVIIDSREPYPNLDCKIFFENKPFDVALPDKPVRLDIGNVTWDDDAVDPVHKEDNKPGSIMFDWGWFNPFSVVGWTSWFAGLKIIVLALMIGAAAFTVLMIMKYAKLIWGFFQEIGEIAGMGREAALPQYHRLRRGAGLVVKKYR